MASHIPDDGNCLLVYGPHVGVDSDGNVGKVNRRGKQKSGTCCGSAVAATKYLKQVVDGQGDILPPPSAALDAQQVFVSNFLVPYASEITEAAEPMITLPYITFRPIDNMMKNIVAKASSKVGPNGKIAMLGGLQVCIQVEAVCDCVEYRVVLKGDLMDYGHDFLFVFAQINTPDGVSDYFLPLRFDLRDSNNELIIDLLDTLSD
jgi:hypothetical protein